MKHIIRKSWLAIVLCLTLLGTSVAPGLQTDAQETGGTGFADNQKGNQQDSDLNDSQTDTGSQNTPGEGSPDTGDGKNTPGTSVDGTTDETESDKDGKEESNLDDPGESEVPEPEEAGIECQTHVQSFGWQKGVKGGEIAGTIGKAKRLEALKISLTNLPEEYEGSSIKYSVHVQSYGWQDEVSNGEQAGTTGQGKRLEAISVWLDGPIAEDYSVYYRTHVQSYGWLGWAKDGGRAGSAQYAKRMEAVEIRLVKKDDGEVPEDAGASYKCPQVSYQTHMQSYGWRAAAFDDSVGGVTGKSKRMEALKISLPDVWGTTGYNGGISYRAYVQGIGWQDWVSDGQIAGTAGQGKRIEAIQVKLTGEIATYYDVYYSLHLAKIGWTNYTLGSADENAVHAIAGSSDLSKRIEALKIKLVKKGDEAPDTSGITYIQGYKSSDFYYNGIIQGSGTTSNAAQGSTLGTTGKSKRLEGITLYLNQDETNSYIPAGEIQYAVHLSSVGWTDWTTQGNFCGSEDGSHGMEAVKIQLSGDISKYYDVYYRAYVQKFGWLGWAKNGQAAGTTKIGYRLEALQVRLVSKDASAPGANRNYYRDTKLNVGPNAAMTARANLYSSPSNYIIMVDRSAHRVGIYQGSRGIWSNIKYWSCGTGMPATPTVTGVFSVGSKGYYFNSGDFRCFWFTQFYGDYLFHSVLCWPDGRVADGRLGMAVSHGCVRLEMQNAKWIYDNIPRGTTVVVYN